MEKAIKGGYILISLGNEELSTYSGKLDYNRMVKTKKHIVLTGIKVSGAIMPDVCVSPIFGSHKLTLSDVYGYDIEVEDDNDVTVSQHKEKKLYRHDITLLASSTYMGQASQCSILSYEENAIIGGTSTTPIALTTALKSKLAQALKFLSSSTICVLNGYQVITINSSTLELSKSDMSYCVEAISEFN